MLNACFREGLDDELYYLLPLDKCCVPLVDFLNYVFWLNGSNLVVDAVNEDNYSHHPVPT